MFDIWVTFWQQLGKLMQYLGNILSAFGQGLFGFGQIFCRFGQAYAGVLGQFALAQILERTLLN